MRYLVYLACIISLYSTDTVAGLKKEITLESGYVANHLDVTMMQIDFQSNKVVVDVFLWKDKASKDAGKSAIRNKRYVFDAPAKIRAIKSDLLEKLKTLSDFSGAIDDN